MLIIPQLLEQSAGRKIVSVSLYGEDPNTPGKQVLLRYPHQAGGDTTPLPIRSYRQTVQPSFAEVVGDQQRSDGLSIGLGDQVQ